MSLIKGLSVIALIIIDIIVFYYYMAMLFTPIRTTIIVRIIKHVEYILALMSLSYLWWTLLG